MDNCWWCGGIQNTKQKTLKQILTLQHDKDKPMRCLKSVGQEKVNKKWNKSVV